MELELRSHRPGDSHPFSLNDRLHVAEIVFDAFADDAGRKTHLAGPIAAALMARGSELLAEPLQIEEVEVLGAKIPRC